MSHVSKTTTVRVHLTNQEVESLLFDAARSTAKDSKYHNELEQNGHEFNGSIEYPKSRENGLTVVFTRKEMET